MDIDIVAEELKIIDNMLRITDQFGAVWPLKKAQEIYEAGHIELYDNTFSKMAHLFKFNIKAIKARMATWRKEPEIVKVLVDLEARKLSLINFKNSQKKA